MLILQLFEDFLNIDQYFIILSAGEVSQGLDPKVRVFISVFLAGVPDVVVFVVVHKMVHELLSIAH